MIYHSNGSILHLLEFEANHIFHVAKDGDVCSFEHSFYFYFISRKTHVLWLMPSRLMFWDADGFSYRMQQALGHTPAAATSTTNSSCVY